MRFLWTRRALPRPRLSFAPASLSLQRRHFSVDHYPTELPGKINSEKQFWHLVKSNTMMPNPFKLAAILTYFVEHPRLKEDRRYVEYMQKHRSILQSHLNFSALQASTIVTSLVKALELQCEHGRALHDALLEGLVRQLPTAPVKSLGHLASWLSRSDAGVDRYSGLWRELLGAAARKEGTLDAQTVVQIIDGARVAGVTDGAAYSFLLREILRVTPPLSPLLSGGTEREELLLQGESEGMLNEDAARKRKGAVRKWQRQRETMDVWSPRQCALALSTVCRLPSPTWTSTVSAEDEKALRELQSGAIERVLGKVTDELTSTMKRVKAEMQIRIGIAERQLRQYNYVSIAFSILHANRAGVEVDSEAFTDAAVAFVKEEIALSPSDLIVFLWTLESLGKSDKDLLERGVRRIVRAEAAGGDERGKVMKLSAKHAIYLAELLATVPETETRDLMDLVGRQTLRAMQSKIQPLYRNQLVRLAYATSRLGPREFGRFWNEHDDLRVQILLQATERAAGEKILSSLAELVVSMGRIAGLVPLPDDGGSSVGGRGAGRRLSSSSSPPGPRVTKEGIAQMAQLVLTAAQSRKGGEAASLVTVLERNAGQDGRMRRILSLVWERLGQNSGDAKGGGAERWGKDRELDSALLSAELSEGALQERREWSVDEAPTEDLVTRIESLLEPPQSLQMATGGGGEAEEGGGSSQQSLLETSRQAVKLLQSLDAKLVTEILKEVAGRMPHGVSAGQSLRLLTALRSANLRPQPLDSPLSVSSLLASHVCSRAAVLSARQLVEALGVVSCLGLRSVPSLGCAGGGPSPSLAGEMNTAETLLDELERRGAEGGGFTELDASALCDVLFFSTLAAHVLPRRQLKTILSEIRKAGTSEKTRGRHGPASTPLSLSLPVLSSLEKARISAFVVFSLIAPQITQGEVLASQSLTAESHPLLASALRHDDSGASSSSLSSFGLTGPDPFLVDASSSSGVGIGGPATAASVGESGGGGGVLKRRRGDWGCWFPGGSHDFILREFRNDLLGCLKDAELNFEVDVPVGPLTIDVIVDLPPSGTPSQRSERERDGESDEEGVSAAETEPAGFSKRRKEEKRPRRVVLLLSGPSSFVWGPSPGWEGVGPLGLCKGEELKMFLLKSLLSEETRERVNRSLEGLGMETVEVSVDSDPLFRRLWWVEWEEAGEALHGAVRVVEKEEEKGEEESLEVVEGGGEGVGRRRKELALKRLSFLLDETDAKLKANLNLSLVEESSQKEKKVAEEGGFVAREETTKKGENISPAETFMETPFQSLPETEIFHLREKENGETNVADGKRVSTRVRESGKEQEEMGLSEGGKRGPQIGVTLSVDGGENQSWGGEGRRSTEPVGETQFALNLSNSDREERGTLSASISVSAGKASSSSREREVVEAAAVGESSGGLHLTGPIEKLSSEDSASLKQVLHEEKGRSEEAKSNNGDMEVSISPSPSPPVSQTSSVNENPFSRMQSSHSDAPVSHHKKDKEKTESLPSWTVPLKVKSPFSTVQKRRGDEASARVATEGAGPRLGESSSSGASSSFGWIMRLFGS